MWNTVGSEENVWVLEKARTDQISQCVVFFVESEERRGWDA